MKNYYDAIECYNQAIELNEKDFESYVCKGNALKQLNDFNGAIYCFNKAIEVKPDSDDDVYLNKGILLNEFKDYNGGNF